jgi:hypothetical protein
VKGEAVGHTPSIGDLAAAVPIACLAAVGVGAGWFALALATGLIYHLLPGAPFLAVAAAYRWRAGRRRISGIGAAVLLAVAAATSAATLVALHAAGRSLDAAAATAAVAVVGALAAWAWLRRGEAPGSDPRRGL